RQRGSARQSETAHPTCCCTIFATSQPSLHCANEIHRSTTRSKLARCPQACAAAVPSSLRREMATPCSSFLRGNESASRPACFNFGECRFPYSPGHRNESVYCRVILPHERPPNGLGRRCS